MNTFEMSDKINDEFDVVANQFSQLIGQVELEIKSVCDSLGIEFDHHRYDGNWLFSSKDVFFDGEDNLYGEEWLTKKQEERVIKLIRTLDKSFAKKPIGEFCNPYNPKYRGM